MPKSVIPGGQAGKPEIGEMADVMWEGLEGRQDLNTMRTELQGKVN